MMQTIRHADRGHLEFLRDKDRHPSRNALDGAVAGGRVLILEEGGAVRAWLRWSLFWDEHPFLNMLYVLEEHRDRGLGRLLLDAWESDMEADQYSRVLTSTPSNERSQHLYRRRGYVDAGVLLLPGEVSELLLSKELGRGEPGS